MTNLIDQSSIRISIHALREEGDGKAGDRGADRPISIHALREEGDCKSSEASSSLSIFLSTPSARRATPANMTLIRANMISIHALREEGDRGMRRGLPDLRNFYPRPPRGGRLVGVALDLDLR